MPIDTRPISELIKDAPLSELKTICSAITPFLKGGEPPQILTLDNPTVVSILKKYGILEEASGGGTSGVPEYKCHPDLGTVILYSRPSSIPGKFDITPYIDPTPVMGKAKEESKRMTGSDNNASPFDTITSTTLLKNIVENDRAWNDRIQKSWEDRSLIVRVVKTPNGETTLQFWEKDPEETKRQSKRALEQAERNNQKVWTTDQYKIITPPITEIPLNRSGTANLIAGGFQNTNVSISEDTNLTTSPLGELAAKLKATGQLADVAVVKKPFYDLYGMLSISKRAVSIIGEFDYNNFKNGVHGTWGGQLHTSKEWISWIGKAYNLGIGGFYTLRGLYKYMTGEQPDKNEWATGLSMVTSELMINPLTETALKNIGTDIYSSLVPKKSTTGKNAFTQEEYEIIKKKNEKIIKDLKKNPTTGRPYTLQNKKISEVMEDILIKEKKSRVGTRIGTTLYTGWSVAKYSPYIFGIYDEVLSSQEELARRNTAMNSIGPNGKPTDQIGIAIQSNNQLIVDSNIIEAINPNTGQIERLTLPGSVCYPPVNVVPSQNGSLESNIAATLQQQENLLSPNIYPLLPSTEDLDFVDKLKKYVVDASKTIGTIESYFPENQMVRELIQGFITSLGDVTDKASKLNWLRRLLTGGRFTTFMKVLGSPAVTAYFLADELRPLSFEEVQAEYAKRKVELDDKLKKGTITKEEYKKLLDKLNKDYEEALRIRGIIFADLLSPEQDPYLNSDVELALEVETAKNDYNNYGQLLASLDLLGDQINSGTSPVPEVDIASINQDISFVTNTDNPKPSWASNISSLNTPWYTPGCFPEYVSVKTDDGLKKISDIRVGDFVISFDEHGNLEKDKVSDIFTHYNKDVWRYYFENDSYIDVTKEHPVLIDINKFEEIGNLEIEDSVIDEFNNSLKIKKVEFLFNGTVYNIEVSKNHTYIAEGIRVHNKLGRQLDNARREQNAREILIFSQDAEQRERDYLNWIEENFPGVLQDGFPIDTTDVVIVGTPPEEVEEPTQEPTPYDGVPDGTPFEEDSDSPIASDGVPRNIPKEILFNLPETPDREQQCFPGYSKIETPRGLLEIFSVKEGDEIFVYDLDGNKTTSKVRKKMIHDGLSEKNMVSFYETIGKHRLYATKNHSVLSRINGVVTFEQLNRLRIGSVLFREDFSEDIISVIHDFEITSVYHIVPETGRIICVDGFLVDTMALEYV